MSSHNERYVTSASFHFVSYVTESILHELQLNKFFTISVLSLYLLIPHVGGISLGLNWVCAVLYILLNICTSASLGSSEALLLIKSIFKEKCGDTVQLNAHSFINSSYASSLLSDE